MDPRLVAAAISWTLIQKYKLSCFSPQQQWIRALGTGPAICVFQASTDLRAENERRAVRGAVGKKGRELIVAQETQKATKREERETSL